MTRPDLGPGQEIGSIPGASRSYSDRAGIPLAALAAADAEEDLARFRDAENEEGLLAPSGAISAEDMEADLVFARIDKKMEERRKGRKTEKHDKTDPLVQTLFSDLKRDLMRVSEAEWTKLPEVGSFTAKRLKKTSERERYTPVPDSLLLGKESYGAVEGGLTDLQALGEARDRVLQTRLDQSGPGTATSVDPLGYLTDLQGQLVRSDTEIGDIKRARLLLKSLVGTNRKNPQAWIAAARVEEVALNLPQARSLINEACSECGTSEDVWLEAMRLNPPDRSVDLLARALAQIPDSSRLWLHAASLEKTSAAQIGILKRALENLPSSAVLWKALIERVAAEDKDEARPLLAKAVECVPTNVELWIALARIETHENARRVLNKARQACPTSHEVWVAAARLEESQGNEKLVAAIVQRAISDLGQKGVLMDRERWLQEARACESTGDSLTAQAIVRATATLGLEPEDQCRTWIDDARDAALHGSVQVARALYSIALAANPSDPDIWMLALEAEPADDRAARIGLFEKATAMCPHSAELWLRFAAFYSQVLGDAGEARRILSEAFAANPNTESIWLAAIDLEDSLGEHERARLLLARARDSAGTSKIWRRSASLELLLGNVPSAVELLRAAAEIHGNDPQLYLDLASAMPQDDHEAVRGVYAVGLERCPREEDLWIGAARFEEAAGSSPIRARSILERGRKLLPKSSRLWLESIRLERRHSQPAMAKALLARALQECPTSGQVWSEAIWMDARPLRKTRSSDALARCGHDPHVYLAVALLMWLDQRRPDAASEYFDRSLSLDPSLGDTWAYYLLFLRESGLTERFDQVLEMAAKSDPKNGDGWKEWRRRLGPRQPFRQMMLSYIDARVQHQRARLE